MLSILIPIYNVDVKKMVNTLIDQCNSIGIDYEVICFDDKSKKSIRTKNNEELQHKFKVNYVELSENIGRAKIRNWLAKSASGDLLLFLDCDSKIIRSDFIQKYLDSEGDVIHGGRKYRRKMTNEKYRLHWLYGRKYESQALDKRLRKPYLTFMSNNFLINAKLFSKTKFDEEIKGYGYEDLVLAEDIRKKGLDIIHIDNPVEHRFLDDNHSFIDKTDRSLINLAKLYTDEKIGQTKLIKMSQSLKDWGLDKVLLNLLSSRLPKWRKQLSDGKASLYKLQMYKLVKFLEKQSSN